MGSSTFVGWSQYVLFLDFDQRPCPWLGREYCYNNLYVDHNILAFDWGGGLLGWIRFNFYLQFYGFVILVLYK